VLLGALVAQVARTFDFAAQPEEDAAILMRYAQHLAAGHGIVWNVGEPPVDGATDFLFMLLLETSMIGYGQWFIDSRGWGDLVQGTALEWPVPYQELFARSKPSYTTSAKAVKGTYGF